MTEYAITPGATRWSRVEAKRPVSLSFLGNWVAAFQDAPAIVAAALDPVNLLPQILADVADPEVARGAVEAHLPGLAQAVGPDFRPGAGPIDERVVVRDTVRLVGRGVVHVEAE